MDPQRLRNAYDQLRSLDERLTHRVRPRAGGGMVRPDPALLDERLRELAAYTVELKEVVAELILSLATRPPAAAGEGG